MFPIARAHVEQRRAGAGRGDREAQAALWSSLRLVAEPAARRRLAALALRALASRPGERVAVLLCGANTDAVDFNS